METKLRRNPWVFPAPELKEIHVRRRFGLDTAVVARRKVSGNGVTFKIRHTSAHHRELLRRLPFRSAKSFYSADSADETFSPQT